MSGVGFSELLLLFVIGLIVLGPERLPRVANQLGTWLGQARRMTRVMKRQLEEELDLDGHQARIQPPAVSHTPRDDDTFSPLHETRTPVAEEPEPEAVEEPAPGPAAAPDADSNAESDSGDNKKSA